MALAWPGILLPGLVLAACASPPAPRFDIGALKPSAEGDQIQLTGWLQIDGQFRLYPEQRHLGEMDKSTCVSGATLSLAGIVPPEVSGRLMSVTGSLRPAGGADVGDVKDECGSGLVLLATDVLVP
jgi:hypothetical protein